MWGSDRNDWPAARRDGSFDQSQKKLIDTFVGIRASEGGREGGKEGEREGGRKGWMDGVSEREME